MSRKPNNNNEVLAKVAVREWNAGRMKWGELMRKLEELGVSVQRADELTS